MRRFTSFIIAVLVMSAITKNASAEGQFRFRNCTDEKIFVCIYNQNDSSHTAVAAGGGLAPGNKKTYTCSDGPCQVYVSASYKKLKKEVPEGAGYGIFLASGATGITTSAIVYGLLVSSIAGPEGIAFFAGVTAAVGVGVGLTYASMEVDGAIKLDNHCKKIVDHFKNDSQYVAKMKLGSPHRFTAVYSNEGDHMGYSIARGDTCK